MSITKDQVLAVSKLSNFEIADSELETYATQLSDILSHIEKLNSVDTSSVEPTFNVSAVQEAWQTDQIDNSLSSKEALANAPDQQDGFFVVKGVFSDE